MVLSDISIKRPVFATVLSLIVLLFGLFGFRQMAVREYPDIDPPIITVNTVYKGASAEIIETQVTQIVEDAIAGIEGIRSINSTSREESSSVSIEFILGRDIDSAANDVRDRVARVLARLPTDADAPTIAKTEADARPIIWLALSSQKLSILDLTDYTERYLVDRFSIIPGVASVTLGGNRRYSMRISLDRAAMAARGVTVQDVEAAIRRQNVDIPSGRIESRLRELSVRTDSSLKTPQEFNGIVVRDLNGSITRISDVAKVELAAENERSEMYANGVPTIGIGIVRQSKSNALEISDGVKATLARVKETLPPGMTLETRFDSSEFIARSIYEVYHALTIAMILVIGVIYLFLRSWRATLIPAVAIPVSIIGSFIISAALGYSINVLTLLSLVLAIGIVVDDAIVVLENVHRRIEDGEPPLLASVRGARQIGFAVIATTVVLIAVFVPISLLEGNTGRLFREFGISVAAAVLFSGFVALTLTPMMCSKFLHESKDEGRFYHITEKIFEGMAHGYRTILQKSLNAPLVIVALLVLSTISAYVLFKSLPREFAPLEDRGVIFVSAEAPEGANIDYTRRYTQQIEDIMRPYVQSGDISGVLTIIAPGFGRPGPVNQSFAIANLRHWDQRSKKQQDIAKEIFPKVIGVPGITAFVINPPSLGQSAVSTPVQVVIGGPSYEVLDEWVSRLLDRASAENPNLLNLRKSYQPTRPELRVKIDRNRAADLQVSVETLGRTLETVLGQREVTTFERDGKQYSVIVRGRAEDRLTPNDLSNIYVRAGGDRSGKIVPLSNIVSLQEGANARELSRVDRLRAITITASLAPNYTLGEALQYFEKLVDEELPDEARLSFGGQSREFKESSTALYFTFILALAVVFLVLAAQFESWIHPTIIMLSVPLAVTGALAAMKISGATLNVYSQIGIIMLVGLIAKNAILIVEFANQLRDEGKEIFEAVLTSAELRLRPILMTSIATLLGAVPLAFAHGAGAESRAALGVVIIGGMAYATAMGLFVVPVLYLGLARFAKPSGAIARSLSELEQRNPLKDQHHLPAE